MDRDGKRAFALAQEVSRGRINLEIEEVYEPGPEPDLKISLLQALLKGDSMAYAIKRLSELGVQRLMIFKGDHSIRELTPQDIAHKKRHWDGIAIRSYLQCDRRAPLIVEGPYKSLLEATYGHLEPKSLKLLFHEKAGPCSLRGLLKGFKEIPPPRHVEIAVGPEGGFSEQEVDTLVQRGFIPMRLGNRIFMAESMGIVIASILQYELGDLS